MGFWSELTKEWGYARSERIARRAEMLENVGGKMGGVGGSAGFIATPVAVTKGAAKGTMAAGRATKAVVGAGTRAVGWGAAIAAIVGGFAYFNSQARQNREFDPRNEPLPGENDTPKVLTADALNEDAAPARAKREVVGPMTAKVLGRTGGLDVSAPNTVGGDGASLIDGKPVKDLGSSAPSLN